MTSLPLLPAVVTAGGRIQGEFAQAAGVEVKALAPVGGRPVVEQVVEALRRSGRVSQIVVVGPRARLVEAGIEADEIIEEGTTGPENFRRGLKTVQDRSNRDGDGRALLCATDLAFLEAGTVRWLVDNAPHDADIIYPIVTQETYEAALPGSPNTYAPLTDGWFTGGSLQIVGVDVLLERMPLIQSAFDARKSVIAMARLLGLPYVLKFAFRRLSVAQAEARVAEILGCRCKAFWVPMDAPEYAGARLCADMDTAANYAYVLRRWAEMYDNTSTRGSEPRAEERTSG